MVFRHSYSIFVLRGLPLSICATNKHSMEQIIRTYKSLHGVDVTYLLGTTTVTHQFSFEDLITMGINVSDLLHHPDYYGYDPLMHRINRTDFCTNHHE